MEIDINEFMKFQMDLMKGAPFIKKLEKEKAKKKSKRKPSKYNLFVKAKSKGQKFKYQSGKDKGKLNMRKIGIAWRKTRR